MRVRPVAVLAVLVGSIGAGAGSVLPWSSLSDGEQTRKFSGLVVGDGRVVLVLAVGLAAMALARLAYRPFGAGRADIPFAQLSAGAIVVLTGLDRMYGPPTLASFRAVGNDVITIRPEGGITFTLVSGVLALAGAAALRVRSAGRAETDAG
ncbi:hypothetical protein [Frankia sp. R82]|uniref:hypothetical protein n=1 Tax=Frankia sp. R82 TaxID=2950553 RepID=UPI00204394DA|nr:hypothetical protein [Frankia sp. R82]MCM3884703.1 hypothetical protein [Frankia sp. R82]